MTAREEFEKWVSSPPFERMPQRYGPESAWPGNYKNPDVQLAWEAWQAAYSLDAPA